MDNHSRAHIYFNSNIIAIENLMPGNEIVHRVEKAGWHLDITLNGMVEINEIEFAAGVWRLSFYDVGDRKLKALSEGVVDLFSIRLHENTYVDSDLFNKIKYGQFYAAMAYPILNIISCLKNQDTDLLVNNKMNGFVQLLVALIRQKHDRLEKFKYNELKNIYQVISDIENLKANFPTPAELIRRTGIQKTRFQKACLTLFGQSAQKIIQHLKMTRAFDALSNERESITNISASLGYRHSPNFITAFHDHFAITPMEVLQKV